MTTATVLGDVVECGRRGGRTGRRCARLWRSSGVLIEMRRRGVELLLLLLLLRLLLLLLLFSLLITLLLLLLLITLLLLIMVVMMLMGAACYRLTISFIISCSLCCSREAFSLRWRMLKRGWNFLEDGFRHKVLKALCIEGRPVYRYGITIVNNTFPRVFELFP